MYVFRKDHGIGFGGRRLQLLLWATFGARAAAGFYLTSDLLAVLAPGQDCQEAQTVRGARTTSDAAKRRPRTSPAPCPSAARTALFLALGQAQLLAQRPAGPWRRSIASGLTTRIT